LTEPSYSIVTLKQAAKRADQNYKDLEKQEQLVSGFSNTGKSTAWRESNILFELVRE